MIQIEEIKIENFRGIRELTLQPNRKSFAIQGPNASGKSCVVDAIEFALTGNLSRLAGDGTAGLSVGSHGMHVDSRKNPAASKVSMRLYHSRSKEVFTITRCLDKPSQPKLKPDTPATRALLAQFGRRDEITLTRRQIAKYVLVQATQRSTDVQNLLRLDCIGSIRKTMASAERKCQTNAATAGKELKSSAELLQRHLQVDSLTPDAILAAINPKRIQLGLVPLGDLESISFLDPDTQGLEQTSGHVVRLTALRDLQAFREATSSPELARASQAIVQTLRVLDLDPKLNLKLRSHKLFELGLELAEEDSCPLCESPRSLEELRAHFTKKLEQSKRAGQIAKAIAESANELRDACFDVVLKARPIVELAKRLKLDEFSLKLEISTSSLQSKSDLLHNLDGISAIREQLVSFVDFSGLDSDLAHLGRTIERLPDQSATLEAMSFLTLASERFTNVCKRQAEQKRSQKILDRAQFVHRTYSDVSQAELETLYRSVEKTFADAYRSLHHEDESTFTARLTPDEGRLDLDVEFFGRGMFPPGAYHSEGHQDSMGLCLYLALMQQVFGDELRLVVLDDVVMSVDSSHRRAICELLKNRFPDTQFIITTHEEIWFYQMQTVGLIDRKNARIFQSWSVDHGPVVSDAVETWSQIDAFLTAGNVPSASLTLRRHLERVLPRIADALGAATSFRLDNKHDLGELKTACYVRLKETLHKAAAAAKEWADLDMALAAEALLQTLTNIIPDYDKESKYVTATIHENAWAKLGKQDFQPVVQAFKDFSACFQCPRCKDWIKRTPRQSSKKLECNCGFTNFALTKPSAEQKATLGKVG